MTLFLHLSLLPLLAFAGSEANAKMAGMYGSLDLYHVSQSGSRKFILLDSAILQLCISKCPQATVVLFPVACAPQHELLPDTSPSLSYCCARCRVAPRNQPWTFQAGSYSPWAPYPPPCGLSTCGSCAFTSV